DRQQQKFFSYTPGVRQGGNKRRIDHIPAFPVILTFLPDDAVNMSHALPYRVTTKFTENMGHRHLCFLTSLFYIPYNFIYHELVVVLKAKGVFYRKSSADIY